ncbi:hypothetical protein [Duganella levis]|uniref:Uncharacterized protein n=1 Tax=Duganella levis TaxID=2692169 RepID=A0ABW9W9K0_9BURK|nr:hypothetical protein [Duganella levis]MYN30683.1 hypothetical protein [Duganella levis]
MDHPDHPIGGMYLPSKVFMALIEHTGEGCYGEKTVAALSTLIKQWIATTPAAHCPWREDEDEDEDSEDEDSDDEGDASAAGETPTAPQSAPKQAASPPTITPQPAPAPHASTPVATTAALLTPSPAPGATNGHSVTRGYQWKQLFLPNGTELRTIYCGRSIYAKVENEQIISDSGPTTPSRLANSNGCGSRNAWQTIWLRLPGSTRWQRAADCR